MINFSERRLNFFRRCQEIDGIEGTPITPMNHFEELDEARIGKTAAALFLRPNPILPRKEPRS
jgi:hypothetical protein